MPRRLPPLNQIRAFEAAAANESFKLAASTLNVTDAAISQHIKNLEQWLGTPLFHRTRQGVRLTNAGRTYAATLSRALDLIAEGTSLVLSEQTEGMLRVSVAPSFASRWLTPRLNQFLEAHPGIEVRPVVSPEICSFETGDIDMAIRHGDGAWPGMGVHLLRREELVPVCAPDLIVGREPLDIAGLASLPLLAAIARNGDWQAWFDSAGAGPLTPPVSATYDSIVLALDTAISGGGVALIDRSLIADDLRSGRLCIPIDHGYAGPKGYYVVYPETAVIDPKIRAFRDWLIDKARKD